MANFAPIEQAQLGLEFRLKIALETSNQVRYRLADDLFHADGVGFFPKGTSCLRAQLVRSICLCPTPDKRPFQDLRDQR